MEEQQQAAAETLSLGARITNVFSSPGEAFDGITTMESKTSLWLVPLLVALLLATVLSFVISTNDTLRGQIVEMQRKAMQEQVDKGNMTQAQADQQIRGMEQMGTLFAVFGAIFVGVGICLMYFIGTLFLWLIGRFALGGAHGYGTYLAMYGTASWIGVLGSVVTSLMILGLNSMFASPAASLAVLSEFDPMNTTHKILSKIELFSLWQAVVVGIGLGKITGKSAGTGIGAAVGILLAWHVISLMLF
ncbi:MAG: YIP1 family protein [Ignavibacteriae bacterium]|nr:YIP1 family protein [Ignavibacteriota bacterium]